MCTVEVPSKYTTEEIFQDRSNSASNKATINYKKKEKKNVCETLISDKT